MPYNRTEKITKKNDDGTESIVAFDYSADTTKFSDIDLKDKVIFVPIDSNFDVSFTRNIVANSVTFSTDDNKIKGSIQLTHIVFSAASGENNSLLSLKNSAKPSIISESTASDFYSDDVVMMSTSSTSSSEQVTLIPKTNLSSNTVYYLNLSAESILDSFDKQISFEVGNGFMTDNSRSFYLTDDGLYNGFYVSTTDSENFTLDLLGLRETYNKNKVVLQDKEINGVITRVQVTLTEEEYLDINLESYRENFEVGDNFYIHRSTDKSENFNLNKSIFGTISKINNDKIYINLDYSCYRMNLSYTADGTLTEITTVNNHNLQDGDMILIYDIVSGDLGEGKYFITKKTDKKFTINKNISTLRDGRLNYVPILAKNQQIINFKNLEEPEKIKVSKKKIIVNQAYNRFSASELLYKNFNAIQYANPSGGQSLSPVSDYMKGFLVNVDDDNDRILNYVAVDSENKIISDNFSNNSIIEFISDDNEKIVGHIKANTYPTQNTHPFNTSAPKVTGFYPEEGKSSTNKIKIVEVNRTDNLLTITTNIKHTLLAGDKIYVEGKLDTIFTGFFTVSSVVDEFNFKCIITKTITENSPVLSSQKFKLLFFNSLLEDSSENLENVDNYFEKNAIFQVNFSQSLNTSSVSVSNSTHLLYANGSNILLSQNLNKTNSTIQLSKSNIFDETTLIDFDSITSNTGNAEFTLFPTVLDRFTSYYLKIKNQIKDLGGTYVSDDYVTTKPITTGFRPTDNENSSDEPIEVPIYDLDTTQPNVRKIYFTNNDENSQLNNIILDSTTYSQISDPLDYENVEVDLNQESFVVLFDETIDPTTVFVNTESTEPFGSIQLSCDDFNTVVQMNAPIVSTTINESDTYTFSPVANLSSNSTYKLKITKSVGDNALNKNYLEFENISNIRSLVLAAIPSDTSKYFTAGETIRGTRRLQVRTSLNLPNQTFIISGLESGKVFYGFNSGARGQVYNYQLDDQNNLLYIDYTPLETEKYIVDFKPGEICGFEEDDETYRFSIEYVAISTAPEGTVIKFIENESRLIYREKNYLYPFNKSNDRIYGYKNKGIARTDTPSEPVIAGIKTTTSNNVVRFLALDVNENEISNQTENVIDISPTSKFIFDFDQTMNLQSFIFSTDSTITKNDDNIIVSYDSNFSNCIPLKFSYEKSNNDTTFKFTPELYQRGYQLSQNSVIHFGVRESAKTKGSTIPVTISGTSGISGTVLKYPYNFKIATTNDFKILKVLIHQSGSMLELLEYDSQQDNSLTNILNSTTIQIIFNEEVSASSLTIGQSNSIELSTDSTFSSNFVTGSVKIYDDHRNRIIFTPTTVFSNLTEYYLRINNTVENPFGVQLDKNYTYAKFTIE